MTPPRFLYRAIKYRWHLDRPEFKLVRASLTPGAIAVDIGAHKGAYLYWMQRWTGPTGKVYAFEPQPLLASYLRRISTAWPHVNISEAAVSSTSGQVARLILPANSGPVSPGAALSRCPSPASAPGLPVPTISLDTWFQNRPPPQLIKCDCEGHELEVFHGARQLLAAHHPALLFECEARHRPDSDTQPIFDYLQNLGYQGSRIDPSGPIPFQQHRPPPLSHSPAGNNFWFIKP